MSKSKHVQRRMSQRGIKQNLVDLTLEFGIKTKNGRTILNKQGLESLLDELRKIEQTVKDALTKGGIVLVQDHDTLVTTYRLDSYRRETKNTKTIY